LDQDLQAPESHRTLDPPATYFFNSSKQNGHSKILFESLQSTENYIAVVEEHRINDQASESLQNNRPILDAGDSYHSGREKKGKNAQNFSCKELLNSVENFVQNPNTPTENFENG